MTTELRAPLDILQVNTADQGGGAEGSAWNLFRAYRDRGYGSRLVVGKKHTSDPDVLLIPRERSYTFWNRASWAVSDRLAPLVRDIRGIGRLRKWVQMTAEPRRELEKLAGIEDFNFPGTYRLLDLPPQRPDLVHCHNLHSQYFDLRALPWLSSQIPVILNLRDTWLLSGHCAYSLGCDRWKTGCGQCPDLSIYPGIKRDATAYNWRRKRDVFARSRLYIATPSQWLMQQVHTSMLRGAQYRVIPNAIDLNIFRPTGQAIARRALNLPPEAKIVLLIAHSKFKDYNVMEAALSQVRNSEGTELLFICLGKSGTEKSVGLGRMVYPGTERQPTRMAQYYNASDVFVHATRAEAFGKTVTEALACGVPVVATAVGGIPEQLDHGKTGFLVPPRDCAAMYAAVERILANPYLRSSMGHAAAEDACQRFGLGRQVNAFLAWYEEILEDWRQE